MIWFTADHHIGHRNILAFDRRPFSDLENQTRILISQHNEVVAPDDTVFFVGDYAMGDINKSLKHVKRFFGKKILVCGNHDRPFKKNNLSRSFWRQKYIEAGFVDVIYRADFKIDNEIKLTLSHFPFKGNDRGERIKYEESRVEDNGQWLIHGHVHTLWRQKGRQINVGLPVWNYYPVSMNTILEIINMAPEQ